MGESDRRKILQSGAAIAGAAAFGFPAVLRAQSGPVRIGHLTPLTGFLGALGKYAVMGIKLAEEEINQNGGVLGQPIEVRSEDSVNPATAATKAQRLIEADKSTLLLGEINSASALAISQVAARNKKLFMSTGARSDALRGANCSRYSFYVDIPNTVMVNTVGLSLLRDHKVQGKKFYSLTADYLFGHDLLRVAKAFFAAHQGDLVGDELIATDVTDFSPYLLKIREAKPDTVCSNLAGNQVTTFIKQYAEFGLPYPIVGFNLNTADAWAAGPDNLAGIWPTPWMNSLDVPNSKAFSAAFFKKYGKPAENHAWIEYITLKITADAINAVKSTDTAKLIDYLEKETRFDILKARKGYFRSWDHQLMQEAFTFMVKPKGTYTNKWDFLQLGPAVPSSNQSLEVLATPKSQNTCKLI